MLLRFSLCVLTFFLPLGACSAKTVLGLPLKDAAALLAAGDIHFILKAPPQKMSDIAGIDPAAPFYAALLLEGAPRGEGEEAPRDKIVALLNEALKSPITRAAALQKLMSYDESAALKKYRWKPEQFGGGDWSAAVKIYSELGVLGSAAKKAPPPPALAALFFSSSPPGAAQKWLFARLDEGFFASEPSDVNPENSRSAEWSKVEDLMRGRIAVTTSSYGPAWRAFLRAMRAEGGISRYLYEYPELLSDFCRALMYNTPGEGIKMLAERDARLETDADDLRLTEARIEDLRFRFLFYSGRMARAARKFADAKDFFTRAVPLAPDGLQRDAAIWYLLDTAYGEKEENIIPLLEIYAPLWTDGTYFSDILDKFGAWAAKKRRWELFRSIFNAIKHDADPETRAKFAYITGRAMEFGLLKKQKSDESAASYYKAAYSDERHGVSVLPPFYYRDLAARRLGRTASIDALIFDDAQQEAPPEKDPGKKEAAQKISPEQAFIDGFFTFGCAGYAGPYIREKSSGMSVEEQRLLAERFAGAREWHTGIRLAMEYMKKPGYKLNTRDLLICYPQGYKNIVEDYAQKAKIDPDILFALIRRESVFNPRARSWAGALGLTQLMEKTGTEMARILARGGGNDYLGDDGEPDFFDPITNTHLGSLYFRQLLDITKSDVMAILSYNGGVGRIRRWRRAEATLSDDLFLETVELRETRNYGRGVLGDAAIYRYLYYR